MSRTLTSFARRRATNGRAEPRRRISNMVMSPPRGPSPPRRSPIIISTMPNFQRPGAPVAPAAPAAPVAPVAPAAPAAAPVAPAAPAAPVAPAAAPVAPAAPAAAPVAPAAPAAPAILPPDYWMNFFVFHEENIRLLRLGVPATLRQYNEELQAVPRRFCNRDFSIPPVFNEDNSDSFTCGICAETPTDRGSLCQTACAHTYCLNCFEAWEQKLIDEDREVTCPICRSVVTSIHVSVD